MLDRAGPAGSDESLSCLSDHPDGCLVRVRVIPRAGRSALAGERSGALVVRLAAAPVEGAANDALSAWLSRCLGVPKSRVRIVAGERSRDKRVLVVGASVAAVQARLNVAGS